ncbi:hypothetical protein [Faecalimicrobium sp. JNUCC 81]
MSINYDILQNFLRCNKNIKLKFRENSNILDVVIFNDVILSLELSSNNIEEHSDIIYNSITNLDGITMYIPKYILNKK